MQNYIDWNWQNCSLRFVQENSKLSKENSGGVAKKNKDCKSIYWNSQIVDRI